MFPRASWANRIDTSPLVVAGFANGSATIEYWKSSANAAGGTAGIPALGPMVFDGTNYQRQAAQTITGADNVASAALYCGYVASESYVFNGSSWDRIRNNSAAAMSATTQPFAQITTDPGEWTAVHAPNNNVQATATKAAGGAGVRHIAKSISFSIVVVALGTAINLNLRDGATGAGTVLWTLTVGLTVAGSWYVTIPGLNIPGSANTAMTLEFGAAPGANSYESVSLTGYSTI